LTKNIAITQVTAPTASFNFSPTSPGQFQTVNFTAEASRVGETSRTITSYEWRFGDGATASGVTATHSYSVLGTYPVTLTVTDSAGIQGTSSQNVTIVNGVTAAFTYSDPPGSLTVIFNAEESRGSNNGFGGRNTITKYIWHFGTDEELVEKSSPITSKTFPAVGTYTVTLTVEDSAGRRQTTNQSILVAN
jgi:PKD repeat protein